MSDAPFDPTRNTLYVGASISQELRDRVAGIVVTETDGGRTEEFTLRIPVNLVVRD